MIKTVDWPLGASIGAAYLGSLLKEDIKQWSQQWHRTVNWEIVRVDSEFYFRAHFEEADYTLWALSQKGPVP